MPGFFSTSREAEITFKMPKLNNTANVSTLFQVTTKKINYYVIFGRDLLQELGIQLDFQNNFIEWKEINLLTKPIDCKMRTHFTIQNGKNVRNASKKIKKILDANYKKANLKNIFNDLKYLSNGKQSLILKLLRKHDKF